MRDNYEVHENYINVTIRSPEDRRIDAKPTLKPMIGIGVRRLPSLGETALFERKFVGLKLA